MNNRRFSSPAGASLRTRRLPSCNQKNQSLRTGFKTAALLALIITPSLSWATVYNFQGGGTTAAPTDGTFSGTGFSPSLGTVTVPNSTYADTLFFGGTTYSPTDDITAQVLANALTFNETGALNLFRGGAGTTNSISLGGTAPAINLNNGGVVNNLLDLSLAANLTVIGAGSFTESGVISGGFGLTKLGTGTLTLQTANTYTGTTAVNRGTVALNFGATGAPANDIISNGSALSLGSGTLTVTSSTTDTVTNSQTFASTALTQGYSGVNVISGTAAAPNANATVNVALGALTRSTAGVVNFTLPTAGAITTTTANTAGTILGGFATVGGTSWAVSAGDGINPGAITALPTASYTSTTTGGNASASYAGQNVDVTSTTGVLDGAATPNSIRFASSTAFVFTLTGTNVIGSGGILYATGAAAGSSLTGGTITSGNSTGELFVTTNNVTVTIGSAIANNGATAGTLVKNGTLQLNVTGTVSITGGVYINQGTLDLLGNNAALRGQIIIGPNGTLNSVGVSVADNANSLGIAGAGNEIVVQNGGSYRGQNGFLPGVAVTKTTILNGLGQGNGGALQAYNQASGAIYSGPIQLGSSSAIGNRPGASAKTFTISSVISELTAGNKSDLIFVRATEAQNSTTVLRAANTYGGNTYVTDNLVTAAATSAMVLNLQGGTAAAPNLPTGTILTLGGVTPVEGGATAGNANGAGRVALGTAAVPVIQTVAGLASAGTSAFNAVYNGATTTTAAAPSSLIINPAAGTSYTYAGVLGAGGTTTLTNGDFLSVTKSGAGTEILTGANTYTGATTVTGGILSATGAGTTPNRTLGGTSSVAISGGGTLLLGAASQVNVVAPITIGTATPTVTTGMLSVATGASQGTASTRIAGAVDGTTSVAGLGTLTLNNTATLAYNGPGTTLVFGAFMSNNSSVLNITGYINGTFAANNTSSGGTGDDRLVFAGTAGSIPVASFAFNGNAAGSGVSEIQLDAGYFEVAFAPVPEPGTWAASLLGLGVIGFTQRRRMDAWLNLSHLS